jgi:hypothetical protein
MWLRNACRVARGRICRPAANEINQWDRRLLRARREQPRRRRAAEQRDELAAATHSITSSARASSVASRPSALAVCCDSGAICCDCCATAYHNLVIGWTSSTQNELALLSSLCAAKRRAGICRPMQVTVRIRASTARDEQDWQGH